MARGYFYGQEQAIRDFIDDDTYVCTTKLSEGKKQPVEPFSSLLQFLAVISGSFREEECSSELRETFDI